MRRVCPGYCNYLKLVSYLPLNSFYKHFSGACPPPRSPLGSLCRPGRPSSNARAKREWQRRQLRDRRHTDAVYLWQKRCLRTPSLSPSSAESSLGRLHSRTRRQRKSKRSHLGSERSGKENRRRCSKLFSSYPCCHILLWT